MVRIAHKATNKQPRRIALHDEKTGTHLCDVYEDKMVFWSDEDITDSKVIKKAQEIYESFQVFFDMLKRS